MDVTAAQIIIEVNTNADKASVKIDGLEKSIKKVSTASAPMDKGLASIWEALKYSEVSAGTTAKSMEGLWGSLLKIKPPAQEVVKSQTSVADSAREIGSVYRTIMGAAVVGLVISGFREIYGVMKDLVKAGSDEAISIKRFGTAFGSSAEMMTENIDKIAAAYQMESSEMMDFASKNKLMLDSMNLNSKTSADMAINMTALGLALGRVSGVDTPEAMNAMTMAMAGNYRGLRQLGIALDETKIKEEARRMGILTATGVLDGAGKAQAVYSLLLQQAQKRLGDTTNNTLTYAQAMRGLSSASKEFAEGVGSKMQTGAASIAFAFSQIIEKGGPVQKMFIDIADVANNAMLSIARQILAANMTITGASLLWARLRLDMMSVDEAQTKLKQNNFLTAEYKQKVQDIVTGTEAWNRATYNYLKTSSDLKEVSGVTDKIKISSDKLGMSLEITTKEYEKFKKQALDFSKMKITDTQRSKLTPEEAEKNMMSALGILSPADFSAAMSLLQDQQTQKRNILKDAGITELYQMEREGNERVSSAAKYMQDSVQYEWMSTEEKITALKYAHNEIMKNEDMYNEERLEAERIFKNKYENLERERMETIRQYADIGFGAVNSAIEIARMATENMNIARQNEISKMQEQLQLQEKQKQRSSEMKGKTKEEISELKEKWAAEDEIAAKQKALKIKQAKEEKAFALFSAVISTAMAVTHAMTTIPFLPLGLAMAVLAGIQGAAQIALIAARPLPSAQFGGSFIVPPGAEADSGLLRVNSGERIDVTPVRETGGGSQRMVVSIGQRDFEAYVIDEMNRHLNNGDVQIRRQGTVKVA